VDSNCLVSCCLLQYFATYSLFSLIKKLCSLFCLFLVDVFFHLAQHSVFRVRQAIVKKEETISQIREQHEAACKRADHLEALLEAQRKKLLGKKK